MDRVFLDANLLFSAAYASDSGLHQLWSQREVSLVTSELALEEARRNLAIHQPNGLLALAPLLARVTVVPGAPARMLTVRITNLPEADRIILSTAVEAGCTHFLTGDKRHFGKLYGRRISGVLILTPAQYLRPRQSR